MRGRRYVGGYRAGYVDDIDGAFLTMVEEAVAADERVYVVLGAYCPEEFQARLAETGVRVVEDPDLVQEAFLVDDLTGHLTST